MSESDPYKRPPPQGIWKCTGSVVSKFRDDWDVTLRQAVREGKLLDPDDKGGVIPLNIQQSARLKIQEELRLH
jgi:hypothetical protein